MHAGTLRVRGFRSLQGPTNLDSLFVLVHQGERHV